MSENPLIQELRDMLAFAAGYKSKNHPGAEAFVPASIASVRAALDELDLLRATPGGATEIHVLDNGSHVTGERAALLLDDEIRSHKITASHCANLQRALTALQESNREVVAEVARWKDNFSTAIEQAHEAERMERQAHGLCGTLRSRLAVADEMAKALEHTLAVFNSMADRGRYPLELLAGEKEFLGKQGWKYLTDALSRWTAPQAAPSPFSTEGAAQAVTRPKCEPASQAIPITPETVVPFPCKLKVKGIWTGPWTGPSMMSHVATHYMIEPTCRPTATEGGV